MGCLGDLRGIRLMRLPATSTTSQITRAIKPLFIVVAHFRIGDRSVL
jgi:hypothetical protein